MLDQGLSFLAGLVEATFTLWFVAMCVGRAFLGTHFPRDMLFGWALAHLLLRVLTPHNTDVLVALAAPRQDADVARRAFAAIQAAVLVAALVLGGIELERYATLQWFDPDPPEWQKRAEGVSTLATHDPTYAYSAAGVLAGGILGALLLPPS